MNKKIISWGLVVLGVIIAATGIIYGAEVGTPSVIKPIMIIGIIAFIIGEVILCRRLSNKKIDGFVDFIVENVVMFFMCFAGSFMAVIWFTGMIEFVKNIDAFPLLIYNLLINFVDIILIKIILVIAGIVLAKYILYRIFKR